MSSSVVFISYRREDSAGHAGRLFDRLVDHLGRDHVFRDIESIEPGEQFADSIRKRLATCDVLLALIWAAVAECDGSTRAEAARGRNRPGAEGDRARTGTQNPCHPGSAARRHYAEP